MSTHEELIKTVVLEFAGEDALEVLVHLKEDEETTDEVIATETGMRLNSVRKILYKLYDLHLASYRRCRDKRTGWFVYHWILNEEIRFLEFLYERRQKVLSRLNQRLEYEKSNTFYYCNNDECQRQTFEDAMACMFKCSRCGKPTVHYDNTEMTRFIQEQIKALIEEREKEE